MGEPSRNMTQAEYLESLIPNGPKCWGCKNINSEGRCETWGHEIDSGTFKCPWCRKNRYLDAARKTRKRKEAEIE